MSRPRWEIAQVLNKVAISQVTHNRWKQRTLFAISRCRTAAMGGHIDLCDHQKCGKLHLSYNSCRNRHCPKCQGHQREVWIRKREAELFNVPYFHVVFTIPHHLNELALNMPKEVYSILFKCAWEVITGFAQNNKFLGAKTGMIAVLHTWGSNLCLHPHLHCIVPGGGINEAGKWKDCKSKGKYLFPVKSMGKVFRAKFLHALNKQGVLDQELLKKPWVVYAKRPFPGPQQVTEYLGRYTHKIAISNHRINDITDNAVSFNIKNYKKGGKKEVTVLSHHEFARRFALHILPKGFVRIRHYGILSVNTKAKSIELIREQTGEVTLLIKREPIKKGVCPHCGIGKLITIAHFDNRGPPKHISIPDFS